jgi:hypothetical protein
MKSAWLSCISLLTAQAVLLSGCATSALWEEDTFARYHQPAKPPNLQLFHFAEVDDILVRYDEAREGSNKTRPRAYWLRGDDGPASNPYKPYFVPVEMSRQFAPIPLVESADAVPPSVELFAVVGENARGFTLYEGGNQIGHFELPAYMASDGRAMQVLLTPFAVVVDTVIVAVVVAILIAPYYFADSNWE